MPTVQHMRDVVNQYTAAHSAGDVDAVAALFAPDAVVADPVDAPEHVGREAVRAFFAGTHEMFDSMDLQATGAIRAVGNWAAVPLKAVTTMGEMKVQVEIIDVFTFNDDGLIADMRAYWTADDITPV